MEPIPIAENENSLSNFDKWRKYCDNLPSPMSFIDAGFLYMISASLQRRVWLPPTNAPLYPNIYVIPTGKAGLGKGAVIKEITKVLKYHKMENPAASQANKKESTLDKDNQSIVENAQQVNFERAESEENSFGMTVNGKAGKKERLSLEKPLCIPMGPDDITYEAFVKAMGKSLRYKDYPKWNSKTEKFEAGIYAHSSMALCLEEISSIFKKNKENVAKFFLNTYDCGDYTYETKTQGKDRIKNCCLNFFGGTTPTFLEEVFSSQLLTDGFASRAWFIFENENREQGFFWKNWTEEQMGYWKDIVTHTGKLLNLYGEVQLSDEVREYLETWWQENKNKRANKSTKLEDYYSRKKVHILKCAVARHFGESTDMTLSLWAVKWAIEFLDNVEKKMHLALGFGNTNPLHKACNKVLAFLNKSTNGESHKSILIEVYPHLPNGQKDLDEILEYLKDSQQIMDVKKEGPLGTEIIYKIKDEVELPKT